MTRRKRTASPSPPQRRVSFEIPASLHHLSSLSRSLATTTHPHAPMSSGTAMNSNSSPRLLRAPSSQPAPLPTRPPLAQHAPTKIVPQKRSLPESKPWLQPGPRPPSHSPRSPSMRVEKAPGRVTTPTIVSAASAAAQAKEPLNASTSPQSRRAPTPTSQTSTTEEPDLEPGETPILVTHPNLIATLIAKKRAENEAKGNRERWARRQAEYRMSKSPASQLMNELNVEASQAENNKSQSAAVSTPTPARPRPVPVTGSNLFTPIVFDPQTPAAETISTPATEVSAAKPPQSAKDQRPNDSDSLFGSPYGSPMAEFLERATDEARLKEALEPNTAIVNKMSTEATQAPQLGQSSNPSTSEPVPATGENATIPPLKEPANPSQPQPSNPTVAENTAVAAQNQPVLNSSTGPQPQSAGGLAPLAPRQRPLPPTVPYYQQNLNIPGYYKIDYRSPGPGTASTYVAPPNVSVVAPNMGYPSQWAPPPPQVAYPAYPPYAAYPTYPMAQMVPYMMTGPPPPPGPLKTYGSTVAAAAAAAEAEAERRQAAADSGLMRAADMVAGINTKFRNATQHKFSVPKR